MLVVIFFPRLIVLFGSGVKYRGEKRPVEFYHDQTDVSLLCLFRVFLQSIHQIILQVYIMLYTDSIHWLTGTFLLLLNAFTHRVVHLPQNLDN